MGHVRVIILGLFGVEGGRNGKRGKLWKVIFESNQRFFFLVVRVADKDVPTLIQLFKKLYP